MLIALLAACTAVQDTHSEQHAAASIQTLVVDIENGNFDYSARPGDFDIALESSGWGRDLEKATAREEGNSWAIDNNGRTLRVVAESATGGRVDADVYGPSDIFTKLHLDSGDASLRGLAGYQVVYADDIYGDDLIGGGEFLGDTVNLGIEPNPGDTLLIDARDVTLELPPGRYDLSVWAEPESIIEIEDFGFHRTALGEGSFSGISGDGAVRIDVFATGNVTIRETW